MSFLLTDDIMRSIPTVAACMPVVCPIIGKLPPISPAPFALMMRKVLKRAIDMPDVRKAYVTTEARVMISLLDNSFALSRWHQEYKYGYYDAMSIRACAPCHARVVLMSGQRRVAIEERMAQLSMPSREKSSLISGKKCGRPTISRQRSFGVVDAR